MNRKSKILLWVFILIIVLSVSATFYRFIILRDYMIEIKVDCNPEVENCLSSTCDTNSTDEETCFSNTDNTATYYKIIQKNASGI